MICPLIEAGLVATCGVIEFELGWATRTSAEFDELRADRDTGYEWLATRDEDWRRALDVQAALWRAGQIRAVGFPDLLIAAVAEREQVTVLHYDSDEDHRTASAMGRPLRDRPVATPQEPHPRRTSVWHIGWPGTVRSRRGLWCRFGLDLAFFVASEVT